MANEKRDARKSQSGAQHSEGKRVEQGEKNEERLSGGEGAPPSEIPAGDQSPESQSGLSSAPGAVPPPSPPHNALAEFVLDMDRVEAQRVAGQLTDKAHGKGNPPGRRSMTPEAITAYAGAYGQYARAEERLMDAQERRAEAEARRSADQVRLRGPFYSTERLTRRVLVIFAIVILVILAAGFIALLVCAIILAFQ